MKKLILLFLISIVGLSCSSDDNTNNEPKYIIEYLGIGVSGGDSVGYENGFNLNVYTKGDRPVTGYVNVKLVDHGIVKTSSQTFLYLPEEDKSGASFTAWIKTSKPLNDAYYISAEFIEE